MIGIPDRVTRAGAEARQRRMAIIGGFSIVWTAACAALGWRLAAIAGLAIATILAILISCVTAWLWLRQIDDQWIARRIDARRSNAEDSAALMFAPDASLTALQRLQRERLHARLRNDATLDLRDPWPRRQLMISGVVGLVVIAAIALVQTPSRGEFGSAEKTPTNASRTTSSLDAVTLDIEAPAYTSLPPRSEPTLDAKGAQGSMLRWRLRVTPRPSSVVLAFHDGSKLELTRDADDWLGERRLEASVLYRIELKDASPLADQSLHRIDAIPDLAPEVRVIDPERSLTLLASEQKQWQLVFQAHDDYGLGDANLQITLAQGGGENVTFKEQTLTLAGTDIASTGGGQSRSYATTLDLAQLGVGQGDDVIVRLSVNDNAQPTPNTTRSASFILRWPDKSSDESSAMEGIVQNTLPAYFRSQRQIIIDSEALVAEQPQLDEPTVLKRSDSIGVDQKILRLRYGQFLGEEFESGRGAEAPTDVDHASADHDHANETEKHDASAAAPGSAAKEDAQKSALDDHDHDAGSTTTTFGNEGNVLAEYGHVHDQAEAATLLDPATRKILKSALDEMWQAELHLRTGEPAQALPYEYRALGYIKQVQQASRIYLARVGLELPQVDESRRLTGKREDLTDRVDPLVSAVKDDAVVVSAWSALEVAGSTPLDLTALERWARDRQAKVPDALGVIAAIDEVRRDASCAACREQLQARLWPLLPIAAARATPRDQVDVSGAAWLDALPESLDAASSKDRP
ncbi:MAG: hypothetical protein ABIP56_03950 [Dokdonella sp.]